MIKKKKVMCVFSTPYSLACHKSGKGKLHEDLLNGSLYTLVTVNVGQAGVAASMDIIQIYQLLVNHCIFRRWSMWNKKQK